MTATINLVDHLLDTGRTLQKLGRTPDALRAFHQLTRFRDLPSSTAAEVQVRLGRIRLQNKQFRKARRHFTAALAHRPKSGRYNYLMAQACRADDNGSLQRAARHYRRALRRNPKHVRCLVEFGLVCIQLGKADRGLAALHRALELAPTDPSVLENYATGLRQAGQADEAHRQLRLGMFRNPTDRRFRELLENFQIQLLLQQQEYERLSQEQLARDSEGPVLLPFVAPPSTGRNHDGEPTILRAEDSKSKRDDSVGPNDQRHVQ